MGREKFIDEKEIFLNNFGNDDINNFMLIKDLINMEIDFRNNLEKRGLWDDKDLLKFCDDLPLNEGLRRPGIPQFEVLPGTVEVLSGFVASEPQRDFEGRCRYLLTSGLAVEVITGAKRYHHDIDLVLFDYRNAWWKKYVTDNVTPDRYWAEMKFDPAYLEKKAWTAHFQARGAKRVVSTVHPAIILVQKLSNAWGRPPRERDIVDVTQLVKFWQGVHDGDPSWDSIIQEAVAALPQAEQVRTRERLDRHITRKPPVKK